MVAERIQRLKSPPGGCGGWVCMDCFSVLGTPEEVLEHAESCNGHPQFQRAVRAISHYLRSRDALTDIADWDVIPDRDSVLFAAAAIEMKFIRGEVVKKLSPEEIEAWLQEQLAKD